MCSKNGVTLGKPAVEVFSEDNMFEEIESLVTGKYLSKKPQIVFVTLPSNDKARNKSRYVGGTKTQVAQIKY